MRGVAGLPALKALSKSHRRSQRQEGPSKNSPLHLLEENQEPSSLFPESDTKRGRILISLLAFCRVSLSRPLRLLLLHRLRGN